MALIDVDLRYATPEYKAGFHAALKLIALHTPEEVVAEKSHRGRFAMLTLLNDMGDNVTYEYRSGKLRYHFLGVER